MFFFGKKNQKTSIHLYGVLGLHSDQLEKDFLLLFLQKKKVIAHLPLTLE